MNKGADIFLSYSRDDQTTARLFAEGFERAGFSVWWDVTLKSGQDYDKVTEDALRGAKAVVVLWSKKSVESRWVRAEATEADGLGTLVPVMIEPCKRPIMFELKQSAELSHWKGDANDPAWQALINDVRGLVTGSRASASVTPLATTGLPWYRRTGYQVLLTLLVTMAMAAALLPLRKLKTPGGTADVSLAVLPFADLSPNHDQDYFSDGLSEEVLNQLAHIPNLRLIGRTSSFSFKGKNDDLRSIGAKLGVNRLLEGSVRKDGNRVRIKAQLIDSTDGSQLWTETYDRTLDDIFATQEEIARTVANALKISIGTLDLAEGGTRNFAAYDAFLAGRALYLTGRSGILAGISSLEHAVELDPAFTEAWVTLEDAYRTATLFHPERLTEWEEKQTRAGDRALALAPGTPATNLLLATRELSKGNLIEAERLFESLKALPSALGVQAHVSHAGFLMGVGRPKDAALYLENVRKTEPLAIRSSLFLQVAYETMGDNTRAETVSDHTVDIATDVMLVRNDALLRAMSRRDNAAIKTESLAMIEADPVGRPISETMLRLFDNPAAALAELHKFAVDPAYKADFFRLVVIADWAAYQGDPALALQTLRSVPKETGSFTLMFNLWRPILHDMRHLPAFKDYVRELGLVDYWRGTGKWGDFCHPVGADDFECQ